MAIMQALMMGKGSLEIPLITGKLFAWGGGATYGMLGLGDTLIKSSPVQVGADTNWTNKFVAAEFNVFAIKGDGTLWGWGRNDSGQLGVGDTTHRSSPTQIGSASDWVSVHSTAVNGGAINSSGELWTWGSQPYGQLGLGDVVTRSVPVQVGSDTDWASCFFSLNNALFMKTTGAIYSTGLASQGSLGTGQVATNQSSPVQIGSDTDWLGYVGQVSSYHQFGIRPA